MNKTHRISITGAGPGDPELLTVKALRRIEQADVILYDALLGDSILTLASEKTELVYVGKLYKDGQCQTERQNTINQKLKDYALQGKQVVRLKTGDPFIFGRGAEELEFCLKENLQVEVIPGISSAFAAASVFQIPLTVRKQNSMTLLYTGRLIDGSFKDSSIVAEVLKTNAPVLVYMGLTNMASLAKELIAQGVDQQTPVQIGSCVGIAGEQLFSCKLDTIESFLNEIHVPMPSIIIIGTLAQALKKTFELTKSENV